MTSLDVSLGAYLRSLVVLAVLSLGLIGRPAFAQARAPEQTFATAGAAAAALVAAVKAGTPQALAAVLGAGSEKLVSSGDRYADAAQKQRFLTAYAQRHRLKAEGADRMLLDVGDNEWRLPIPIVRAAGRWHFDSTAGAEALVDRRIGRNEILAIRTLLACVDAEHAYFSLAASVGHPEYAGQLVSTAGKRDGLYWPAAPDAEPSPLGPLVATAEQQGYPGNLVAGKLVPYQGYYFRILKAQGASAPGGARSYLEQGRMSGGFALVAWPASYGSSGIMTFVVDQGGTVFQKNLGPDTASRASAMQAFDPDLSWTRVDVTRR